MARFVARKVARNGCAFDFMVVVGVCGGNHYPPPGREQANRSQKRHQTEFQSGQTRPGLRAHLSIEWNFSDRLHMDRPDVVRWDRTSLHNHMCNLSESVRTETGGGDDLFGAGGARRLGPVAERGGGLLRPVTNHWECSHRASRSRVVAFGQAIAAY